MECICGNKVIETKIDEDSLIIEGKEYFYNSEFYYCSECGKEWLSPEQLNKQSSQITEIKRNAAGFLTPSEIASLRDRHGLTQEEAATIFGGGRNAFSKYERGEAYPSRAMDTLMVIFDKVPEAKRALYEKANMKILDVEEIEIGSIKMTIDSLPKRAKIIPFPSSKTTNHNLDIDLSM